MEKIRQLHAESHQIYGAPKIARELHKTGEVVTEKTVGNYMRQMGLKAHWVKPYTQTTIEPEFSNSRVVYISLASQAQLGHDPKLEIGLLQNYFCNSPI